MNFVEQSGTCPDQCNTQLQHFADQLGCCYQSIYNNTHYVQAAADIGELNQADVDELRMISNPKLWHSPPKMHSRVIWIPHWWRCEHPATLASVWFDDDRCHHHWILPK